MIRPFGINEAWFIFTAIQWTLALSAVAFAGGAVGGLLVALARVSRSRLLNVPALAFIRLFQGTPLLMQLFLTYFGLRMLGLGLGPWTAAAIALTLHASAFLGEIWRGCIEAVPEGQSEASWALGLSYFDRMQSVVLPQAARIAASYADPTKANKELNWSAGKTIDDMCADTWRWQSANPQGYPD